MFEKIFKAVFQKGRNVDVDAKDLRIDAELLCCPVCFSLYAASPLVIPCGHTLCSCCLDKLTGRGSGRETTFACPICRKSFSKNRSYPKNYAVESILNSIEDWVESDEAKEKSREKSERIIIGRLKKKVEELSSENSRLNNEAREASRRQSTLILKVSVIVGISTWIFFRLFSN